MLHPYLFGARLCSINWAISAFVSQIQPIFGCAHCMKANFPICGPKTPRSIHKQKRQLVAVLKSGTPAQTRAKGKPFHFAESRKESHCKTRLELATPALTSNVDSLSFWDKVVLYQLSYFRICFTNSAHFWLRSLRESKLSHSLARKFRTC